MVYEIYGIEDVNYTSRKTGRQVRATNLHCVYNRDSINGTGCERLYVPNTVDMPHDLDIGDHIEVYYNRFQTVEKVVKV